MKTLTKWIVPLLLVTTAACGDSSNVVGVRQAVIKVDNHVLTLEKFNEFFESVKMNYERDDVVRVREARARYLLQMLEEMLITRRAEELGISVTPDELDAAVSEVKGSYTEEGFGEMLMIQAVSLETWRERLQKQLLVQKVIRQDLEKDIAVAPEDIRRYFDQHKKQWHRSKSAHVLHILVPDKKQGKQILQEVKNGADFAEMARKHSTALEATEGGDMGFVQKGDLPEELERPIFALKTNEVSPVIKTSFGFHIFKVTEKRPAGGPIMDDLIEEIKTRVKQDKVKNAYGPWLSGLRSRYDVKINEEII